MVMVSCKLCDGTLEDFLVQRAERDHGNDLTPRERLQALDYFSQILEGVKFCHEEKNVIHRDIKVCGAKTRNHPG
eukprot:m.161772 g.161772  ORF g.161772 m.161772 type:complete len:75 (+) comp13402_c2_seq5:38-262(+)